MRGAWISRRGAGAAAALLVAACGLQPPERPASGAPSPPPGAPAAAQPPDPGAAPGTTAQPPGPTATPGSTTPGAPPATPAPSTDPPAPFPGYALAWRDEFDGTAVDRSRWRVDEKPRRAATNSVDAVAVKDGVLRLSVYTEGGVTRTGFLDTDGLFETRYGYLEARIRFTSAPGEWCAFWLQSPTIGVPLGDPATAGVEIDVAEHRFTDQNGWALADWIQQGVNWDGYGKDIKRANQVTKLPGDAPVQGQWHNYAVLWEPDAFTFYVDGKPLWRTTAAVSHRGEFLQLTCEVESSDWAGIIPPAGYGPRATSAIGMDVDWVHVWQKP